MTECSPGRELAFEILTAVLEEGRPGHTVVRRALDKYACLPRQERAFAARLSGGTVEYLLTIDAVLNAVSSVKVKKMRPAVRTILRLSIFQLLWMDSVPDRAVLNEAVLLACAHRFAALRGFINGVLRAVCRRKEEFVFDDWSLKYSMPQWLIDLWLSQLPKESVESMLISFHERRPVCVRINRSRADRKEILQALAADGIAAASHPLTPDALLLSGYENISEISALRRGLVMVQDAASILAGEAVRVRPGDTVLDLCGAPGGKGLHLADRLSGSGHVRIRDISSAKISLIEENIAAAGFQNVRAEVFDARVFDPDWEERADIVLADLPCSGLGVIARKQDIRYNASREGMESLVRLQREILAQAVRYIKPGGLLVYSTCTVNRSENEEQRQWLLKSFGLTGCDLSETLPALSDTASLREGYVQLLPGRHPCDGFFISVYQKKSG